VLRAVVAALPLARDVDRVYVFEMLAARGRLGSTSVGDGILEHCRRVEAAFPETRAPARRGSGAASP